MLLIADNDVLAEPVAPVAALPPRPATPGRHSGRIEGRNKTGKFFITGLNRSRTSWLTMLMRYGPVYCHHEWMADCNDLTELFIRMADRPEAHVGNCDATLLPHIHEVRKEGPVVVVRRNPAHVAVSFSRMGIKTGIREFEQWTAMMSEACAVADLVVDFNALDTELVCRKIWETCVPQVPFPQDHFRFIRQFNIKPSAYRIRELTARVAANNH